MAESGDRWGRRIERMDWWVDEQMDRGTCHGGVWAEAGRCKELTSVLTSHTDIFTLSSSLKP